MAKQLHEDCTCSLYEGLCDYLHISSMRLAGVVKNLLHFVCSPVDFEIFILPHE